MRIQFLVEGLVNDNSLMSSKLLLMTWTVMIFRERIKYQLQVEIHLKRNFIKRKEMIVGCMRKVLRKELKAKIKF